MRIKVSEDVAGVVLAACRIAGIAESASDANDIFVSVFVDGVLSLR